MQTTTLEAGPRIEVPKVLTSEQRRFFVENGYLVVPALVTADEVQELIADTLKVARGGYPNETIEPAAPEKTDEQVLREILCIHQPHYISPVMEKFVRHPQIAGALSDTCGAHLPHWDGSVKCMQSMLFVKPPGFQGQAWHQDELYIPTRDRSLIGAWIAIDDASAENGCLWVIPGSHQTGMLYPQKPHDNNEEFDFGPESYGFDASAEIPVEVKSGSVVFFNGYLLHRSKRNRSRNSYRRVLVNHYCNAWSLLPWRLKEGEGAAGSDFRGIVPVAGVDPYAYKGYVTPEKSVYLRWCKEVERLKGQRDEGAGK